MKLSKVFFGKEIPGNKRKIGSAEIEVASRILREYKNAKSSLESRIVDSQ